MAENLHDQVKSQVRRIDTLDKKADEKVIIDGKEAPKLTEIYIQKIKELQEKTAKLDEDDPERARIDKLIYDFLLGIDEKNIQLKEQELRSRVNGFLEAINERVIFAEVQADIARKQESYDKTTGTLKEYYDRENRKEFLDFQPKGRFDFEQRSKTQREMGQLLEEYAVAQKELLAAYAPLMTNPGSWTERGEFLGQKIPEIRLTTFTVEKSERTIDPKALERAYQEQRDASIDFKTFVEKYKSSEQLKEESMRTIVIATEEIYSPSTPEDYAEKMREEEEKLLQLRRDMYLKTGDEKYRESFEKTQEAAIAIMKKDGEDMLTQAAQQDNKGKEQIDILLTPLERETSEEAAKRYANGFAEQFDAIQRLQAQNPRQANLLLAKFMRDLQDWQDQLKGINPVTILQRRMERKSPGSFMMLEPITIPSLEEGKMDQAEFIQTLNGSPALSKAFSGIVNEYSKEAKMLELDVITRNPDMNDFQDDMSALMNRNRPFLVSINTLMGQVETPPSREMLETWVYPMAREVLSQKEAFNKILHSPMVAMVEECKMLNIKSPVLDALEQKINQAKEYIEMLERTAEATLKLKDTLITDAFKELGKRLLIMSISLAVMYVTGGAGALLVGTDVLGGLVFGSLGIAAGDAVAVYLVEGDSSGFKPENFLSSWVGGMVTLGGAKYIGGALGQLAGRFLSSPVGKALGAEKYMGQFFQRAAAGQTNIFLRATRDLRTMFLAGGLTELVGEEHPILGFILANLAFMHAGVGKGYKGGTVMKIGKTLSCRITEGKIEMTYTDKAEAMEYLRKRGATEQMISTFEATGRLDVTHEGIRLEMATENPETVRYRVAQEKSRTAKTKVEQIQARLDVAERAGATEAEKSTIKTELDTAKEELKVTKAQEVIAGIRAGVLQGFENYEGIRDAAKEAKLSIEEQCKLARKFLENSGRRIEDLIRLEDTVGEAREVRVEGTVDDIIHGKGDGVEKVIPKIKDAKSLSEMDAAIREIMNPAERQLLEKLSADLRAMKESALEEGEKVTILKESMRYLKDYKAALREGNMGKIESSQDIFNLIRRNQRVLAHQTIVDRAYFTGSDHGVTHILDANMAMADKIFADMGGKLTARERILIRQAILDHDMGYTINALAAAKVGNRYFAMTTDHPLYSTIWVESNKAEYVKYFGEKGYQVIRDAILDHSNAKKMDLTARGDQLIKNIVAGVDCLGTTADIKMMKLFRNPEMMSALLRLQDLATEFKSAKTDAEKIRIKAQMKAVHDAMKDYVMKSNFSKSLKDSYLRALEHNFNSEDPTFAFKRDFGSHSAGFEDIRVAPDDSLTVDMSVNENLKLVRDMFGNGDEVSTSALRKAMENYGLEIKEGKSPVTTVVRDGVETTGQYSEKQFAEDLAKVERGELKVLRIKAPRATFNFIKNAGKGVELSSVLRREGSIREAIRELDEPNISPIRAREILHALAGRHDDWKGYSMNGKSAESIFGEVQQLLSENKIMEASQLLKDLRYKGMKY